MQFQQKRWPHSVEQLSVRSSRHNVQFLPALTAPGMAVTFSIVRSSSSAGLAGSLAGSESKKSETGFSSINSSDATLSGLEGCLPLPGGVGASSLRRLQI